MPSQPWRGGGPRAARGGETAGLWRGVVGGGGARAAAPGGRRSGPMIRRYTLPEMGAVLSDQARFEQMLRVEVAVARAEVETHGVERRRALHELEERMARRGRGLLEIVQREERPLYTSDAADEKRG